MSIVGLDARIIELLNSIFVKHSYIERAVLFGSRAKGIARNNSDIDIAIFGQSNEMEIEAVSLELDELPLPYKFDVKAFDSIRNAALRDHIDRVGVCIYTKDDVCKEES